MYASRIFAVVLVVVGYFLGFFAANRTNPVVDGEIRVMVSREYGSPVTISTDWQSSLCPPVFKLSGDAEGWKITDVNISGLRSGSVLMPVSDSPR